MDFAMKHLFFDATRRFIFFVLLLLPVVLLSCNMDDLLKGLETKISEQDNKIAQLEKEQRESTNGQLNDRISQIETDIVALQTSSTSAEADQNAIEQKIATLQTEITSLKTAQGTAVSKADLQALIERAESLESNVAAMQKEIDTLKSGSTGGSTGTKSAEQLRQELLIAIRYSSLNIANALLDAGADPKSKYYDYDDIKDGESRTALVLAVANDLVTVVQKLIEKGADATAQSKNSYNIPLFQVRSEAVYDILVTAGADVNFKDKSGDNFLSQPNAIYENQVKGNEFAAILLKAVAEGLDINAPLNNSETLLSKVLGSYDDDYLEKIKAILAIPSLDINARIGYNSYTALQIVASDSFRSEDSRKVVADTVTELLKVSGVEVNKKTTSGETALDLLDGTYCRSSSSTEEAACTGKKAEVRKLLTDAGAKLAADLP